MQNESRTGVRVCANERDYMARATSPTNTNTNTTQKLLGSDQLPTGQPGKRIKICMKNNQDTYFRGKNPWKCENISGKHLKSIP